MRRGFQTDVLQLGGAGGQSIQRDAHTGDDDAAAIIPVPVKDAHGAGRAQIKDDERGLVFRQSGDRVDHQVGTQLFGIIDQDVQTSWNAGADDQRLDLAADLQRTLEDVGQLRHDRGNDAAGDLVTVDAVHEHDIAEEDGIFMLGLLMVRGYTGGKQDLVVLYDADDDVGVAGIQCD